LASLDFPWQCFESGSCWPLVSAREWIAVNWNQHLEHHVGFRRGGLPI
jgi:hypothetical protein